MALPLESDLRLTLFLHQKLVHARYGSTSPSKRRSVLIVQQVAMRLLEKDIHDKQDTLISIRRQLEDVKKLNLELHNKLQVP